MREAIDVKASRRYIVYMTDTRRATVYFDPEIHRALKLRAASMDRSISEMVNEAVRDSLSEDAYDLAVFDERENEPDIDFEEYLKSLKRRGKI